LKEIEVHTYNGLKTVVNITDSGICDVLENCPKICRIFLCSKTNGITEKSVVQFSEKANTCLKVKHHFYSFLEKRTKRRESHLDKTDFVIPENLSIAKWPEGKTNCIFFASFEF
jgi:hypothetical protein